MIDLSNNDKHGYPPRGGGRSGVASRLHSVDRFMKVRQGDWTGVRFEPDGTARSIGRGSVVISGQVVDRDGGAVGDLYDLLHEAVTAWKVLVAEHRGSNIPTERERFVNAARTDGSNAH